MVRKVMLMLVITAIMLSVLCTPTFAVTHNVYSEGTISSTYVTYFKDILAGIGFNENYVAFRGGQYEYYLIVGDLEYNNGTIILNGTGKEYKFATTGNYNSQYSYTVNELSNFSVNVGENVIYSDVGDFPQLIERGAKIETVTLMLLVTVCVVWVIERIFRYC